MKLLTLVFEALADGILGSSLSHGSIVCDADEYFLVLVLQGAEALYHGDGSTDALNDEALAGHDTLGNGNCFFHGKLLGSYRVVDKT